MARSFSPFQGPPAFWRSEITARRALKRPERHAPFRRSDSTSEFGLKRIHAPESAGVGVEVSGAEEVHPQVAVPLLTAIWIIVECCSCEMSFLNQGPKSIMAASILDRVIAFIAIANSHQEAHIAVTVVPVATRRPSLPIRILAPASALLKCGIASSGAHLDTAPG